MEKVRGEDERCGGGNDEYRAQNARHGLDLSARREKDWKLYWLLNTGVFDGYITCEGIFKVKLIR